MVKYPAKNAKTTKEAASPSQWACRHHDGGSNIDAYDSKAREWTTILTTAGSDFDAHEVAERIVTAVNNEETYLRVMEEMAHVLESCLEKDRVDWSTEHDSEVALNRYRALIKARRG